MTKPSNVIELAAILRERAPATVRDTPVSAVMWEASYPDFRYTSVTETADQFLGFPRAQWTGEARFWQAHVHPDDIDSVCARRARVEGRQDYEIEYRMVDASGTTVWVQEVVHVVRNAQGSPLAWRGVLLDISARKSMERTLRETEERFRTAVNLNPHVVMLTRLSDSHILYVNDSIERVTGFAPTELIGKSALDVFWKDPDARARFVTALRDSGLVVDSQQEFVLRDGTTRIGEISSALVEFYGQPCAVTTVRDITQERQQQLNLARINRALRVLANSNEVLVTVEREPGLLEAICSALVAGNGYAMCSAVLVATPDADGFRVMATAGGAVDCAAARPAGDGPLETTLRTGRVTLSRGIRNGDEREAWRREALAHGCHSVLGLPLSIEGATIGALMIGTAETGGFGAGESEVLEKLAGSVVLRLAAIRSHRRQQHAESALRKANAVLRGIHRAQSTYISSNNFQLSFEHLLNVILELTGSEFGFVAELKNRDPGRPFLQTVALTNIAWNAQSRALYAKVASSGIIFDNLDTLFGAALKTRQTVISNSPGDDSRAGGLPAGHPPLTAFMGIPVWGGADVIGLVGIANRKGGYEPQLEYEIESLLLTCGSMIQAEFSARRRQDVEKLLALENRALAIVNQPRPIDAILDDLLRMIEEAEPALRASVMLLDHTGRFFGSVTAPSMPRTYLDAVHGFEIGEGRACCGTAAFRREPVIVPDVEEASIWAPWLDLARGAGIRACWSMPLIAGDGTLLGTFAVYFDRPRSPSALERELITRMAAVTALAVAQFKATFERGDTGRALLDVDGVVTHANRRLVLMLGVAGRDLRGRHVNRIADCGESLISESQRADLLARRVPVLSRECSWRDEAGQQIAVRMILTPVFPFEHEPYLIAEFADISSEKRAASAELQLSTLIENSLAEIYVVDAATLRFTLANRGARVNLGYTAEDFMTMGPLDLVPHLSRRRLQSFLQPLIAGDAEQLPFQSLHRRKDRSLRSVEGTVQLIDIGNRRQYLFLLRDITERLEYDRLLRRHEEIVSTVSDFIAFVDSRLVFQTANRTYVEAFGRPLEEIVGRPVAELYAPAIFRDVLEPAMMRVLQGGNERLQLQLNINDGYHDIDTQLHPYVEADGTISGLVMCGRDITDLRVTESELFLSEERFRALYDDNPSMLFTIDRKGRILSVNLYGAQHLGYAVSDLQRRKFVELLVPESVAVFGRFLRKCYRVPHQAHKTDLHVRAGSGVEVVMRQTGRVVTNPAGDEVLLLAGEDVTEAKRLSAQLEYQAAHDVLTGLVNRVEFERRVVRLLDPDSTSGDHAFCYIDLDEFKAVNDSCGHAAGDELLRQMAVIMQNVVRKRDTLARLGGDEFGVLMEHCPLAQAERVANELCAAIGAYEFRWEGRVFRVGASIGVVTLGCADDTLAEVIRAADMACYEAKRGGRNRVHLAGS